MRFRILGTTGTGLAVIGCRTQGRGMVLARSSKMHIPLSDPVWTRLYGPYGVQDVAGDIGRLLVDWDKTVADELFWERLHHQETLYPVTYAALPWLREVVRQKPEARREVLLFLSWMAFCAIGPEQRPSERFVGLSSNLAAHHSKWLSKEIWLTEADLPVLQALGDWMESELPRIAEDCLAELKGEASRGDVAYLAVGPLAIWGGREAAIAVEMANDGHSVEVIREELELNDVDRSALSRLVASLSDEQVWLREFAYDLAGIEPRAEQDDLQL